MPEVWEGKAYTLTESENFDGYLKALGKHLAKNFMIFLSGKEWKRLQNNSDRYIFLSSFDSGVGFFIRKIANSVKSTIELTKIGDQYTLKVSSALRTFNIPFKLGEEFDEEAMDGRKVKSTITAEGNKFTHKQIGTPSSVTTREFTEKELIVTLIARDVTCTQKYTAQQ